MRIIQRVVAIGGCFYFLLIGNAFADKLPEDLTFQCSGSLKFMKHFPSLGPPQFENRSFNITIHLKNKTIADLTNNEVLGKNCFLEKGQIGCELDEVKYVQRHDITDKRHGIVLITRDTGAIRLLHTMWLFVGRSAGGTPNGIEKTERTGTCRRIRKEPIF